MASLFKPLWYCGARDSLGAAIATGSAYFYVVGSTSTFVDVYADAAETTPITHDGTHPIVLDAGGRAQVYLKAPAKVIIKDSTGAVKQTIAEGTATDAGLVNGSWGGTTATIGAIVDEIEDSLGLSALYKESSEAGVATRTYHNVVKQFISPYDFGCAGNGTTDDTTKLQAAIDRAIATKLPLNLEAGTYKITSALSAAGIISIYGAGMGTSIITTTATGITGLSVVASGTYLRDFAIHLPYDGTTYDKAISITGSTCTVERVEVTGGQGIVSTAPHTRIVDCVVSFKCPNTAGAYGSGIDVSQNSVVENCSVDGKVGNSATYLTRGIYLQSTGAQTTCTAIGCRTVNCYVGGEGGLFLRCEFDTCTTGVKCIDPLGGAAFSRMTSCTTPILVSGAFYPINLANHFDGALQYLDGDTTFSTSATSHTDATFSSQYSTQIFELTYGGTATITLAQPAGGMAVKIGTHFTIVLQLKTGTSITGALTSDGWILESATSLATGLSGGGKTAIGRFIWAGTSLVQASDWMITASGTKFSAG